MAGNLLFTRACSSVAAYFSCCFHRLSVCGCRRYFGRRQQRTCLFQFSHSTLTAESVRLLPDSRRPDLSVFRPFLLDGIDHRSDSHRFRCSENQIYRAGTAVVQVPCGRSKSRRKAMVSSILDRNFSKKNESWTLLGGVDLIVLWTSICAELVMLAVNFARKTADNIWRLWHELSMLPRKSIDDLRSAERYGLLLLIPLHAAFRSCRVILVCLVPLSFVYSINKGQDRPLSVSWLSHRVGYRLQQIILPSSANPPISVVLKPLFDAVAFVRDRTSIGELVYSNLLSEDLFWFLSSGRISLLDGTSIYQLYLLQKESARRIRQFADFAITADMEDVEGFNFKYLLLYKGGICGKVCYGDQIFLANLGRFEEDPRFRLVFENAAYVVFERMNVAAGSVARLVTSTTSVEAAANSQNGGLGR